MFFARKTALCALVAVLFTTAIAQSTDGNEAYRKAMVQSQTGSRILALEDFVHSAGSNPLKVDALEVLVWNYKQINNQPKALAWATRLLDADAENPLALAVLADSARYSSGGDTNQSMANSIALANRGLVQAPIFRKPESMPDGEFRQLQAALQAWLEGSIGFALVHQQDYANARPHLRKAAATQPENPQYAYELALADLTGKQQVPQEGFFYLARTVDLTQGTPAGAQIARYAFDRYRAVGGHGKEWGQFLVAAAPPASTQVAVASAALPDARAAMPNNDRAAAGSRTNPPQPSASAGNPAQPSSSAASSTRNPEARAETAKAAPERHLSEEEFRAATLAPPPLPPTQTAPKPVAHPGAPVSVGILLQAAINNKDNRRAVTYALSDLVRHLRENDEAFILSFSHDLVFEQDLTANYDLLREAVDAVKPHPGTALLDAVGFASGHLNRIARKNNNRVLLVISDGRDTNSKSSPYEVTGAIDSSGVKIYCIGFGIGDSENRSRLQALASRTGGQASFVSDGAAFRSATRDISRTVGIDFPQQ